jgi:hypothetical protein
MGTGFLFRTSNQLHQGEERTAKQKHGIFPKEEIIAKP